MDKMQNENPVLCIPRMEKNISKGFIINKLQKLDFGYIEKVTEIPLKNGTDYKRIIIKINWNSNPNTIVYKKKLTNGESLKLVYDMNHVPWFWKIVVSNFLPSHSTMSNISTISNVL